MIQVNFWIGLAWGCSASEGVACRVFRCAGMVHMLLCKKHQSLFI